jgi:glycosyltransferase involved in cell wall biosynthesis
MRFCCITPCLNAEAYIEHTIRSVVAQSAFAGGTNQLHYIIQDGGSADKTVEKARSLAEDYADNPNISIVIYSEKDRGMYDALGRALQKLPAGDICSYINAGDYYSPHAFEIVAELFTQHNLTFLTGLRCVYNDRNHLINCTLPYRYRKTLLLAGFYGTILPSIQQESTFWDFSLNAGIDYEILSSIRLAGDYYLWKTFIQAAPLYIVSAHLGGFKIHREQLSEKYRREYIRELRSLADKPGVLDYLIACIDKILWYTPNGVKKRCSADQIYQYDFKASAYIKSSQPPPAEPEA